MTIILYTATVILLAVSLYKDKQKTVKAIKKAWKAFENIMPQFLGVLVLTGIVLSIMNAETISRILGVESGWLGTIGAAVVGSVTLIPGFVAFPTASILLQNGAGYMQIAAFVSTLMMVGVITFPVEIEYFGVKTAVIRNLLAFLFSFLVAVIIGWVHTV
ncbi:MAG: permease [Spirochaetia bacterium]|nr:permease [Spirochaetia bacterium]MDZ7795307.1 permease [Spirochaetia bacterium]